MARRPLLLEAALLAALCAAWFYPVAMGGGLSGGVLAHPGSELPVKLWCFEKLPAMGFFGGPTTEIGFPGTGMLNNPDPAGMVATALLRPLLGRDAAYNVYVGVQLWANAMAVAALARVFVASRFAALFAGVATSFTPLLLTYGVASAVTDQLSVWPYVLALRAGLLGLQRPGWRDGAAAGAWLGLGFFACPYHLVVFAVLAPVLVFVAAWWAHRGAGFGQLGRTVLAAGLVGGLLVGAYALRLRTITQSEGSRIPAELIDATRHAPPFPRLDPRAPDRYVAQLEDYVAVGKSAVRARRAGSVYLRAYQPGFVVYALAALGLATRRRRGIALGFVALGLWAALAATGPFLAVDPTRGLGFNPAFQLGWGVLGGWILLEPFRYFLPAALCLALAAAVGADALARRFGDGVPAVFLGAWLLELVAVSPVPFPLPVAYPRVDPALADLLAPGAVLHLPMFEEGSEGLRRSHFLDQLGHGHPIADEVTGFPPVFLTENPFTATLLSMEGHNRFGVAPGDPSQLDAGRRALSDAGFGTILIERDGYRDDLAYQRVLTLLRSSNEGPAVVVRAARSPGR